jgi:hypothetical protein
MPGRPRILPEVWRLPKSGPQLACPGRDHGGASKPNKIPSLHAILILAANAATRTSVSMGNVDLKALLIVLVFTQFPPLVVVGQNYGT